MKHVVSVSLGSRRRDHQTTMMLMGQEVALERRGTDGEIDVGVETIQRLDGTVDAIGLGGIDRYLVVGDRRYEIQDAIRLAKAAKVTPVVDGSGVKDTLERTLIYQLHHQGLIRTEQSVLMVSAMDRFGMAETFEELGYALVAGDLIFASRINYPIRSSAELAELARKLLPELSKMPFHQLYPIGDAQNEGSDPRFQQYFDQADIIAGDFHYIRRYLPESLRGKIVITNTTTTSDVVLLRDRGVRWLVTTTPVLDQRSFGTNVIEAALVAVTGYMPSDPEWIEVVRRANLRGTIQDLTS